MHDLKLLKQHSLVVVNAASARYTLGALKAFEISHSLVSEDDGLMSFPQLISRGFPELVILQERDSILFGNYISIWKLQNDSCETLIWGLRNDLGELREQLLKEIEFIEKHKAFFARSLSESSARDRYALEVQSRSIIGSPVNKNSKPPSVDLVLKQDSFCFKDLLLLATSANSTDLAIKNTYSLNKPQSKSLPARAYLSQLFSKFQTEIPAWKRGSRYFLFEEFQKFLHKNVPAQKMLVIDFLPPELFDIAHLLSFIDQCSCVVSILVGGLSERIAEANDIEVELAIEQLIESNVSCFIDDVESSSFLIRKSIISLLSDAEATICCSLDLMSWPAFCLNLLALRDVKCLGTYSSCIFGIKSYGTDRGYQYLFHAFALARLYLPERIRIEVEPTKYGRALRLACEHLNGHQHGSEDALDKDTVYHQA